MLGGFLARLFRGPDSAASPDNEAAWRLYRTAVARARTDTFYTDYGIADSIDGRFDLIILHVILLIRRLRRDGESTASLVQSLFDVTFADMDRSLREMGVGDLGVGRRVKAMAKAFYGRAQAYEEALDAADGEVLIQALHRNLLNGVAADSGAAEALAAYVRQVDGALGDQATETLTSGEVVLAAPSGRAGT